MKSSELKKNELRKQNIQNTIEFLSSIPGTTKSKAKDDKTIEDLQSLMHELEQPSKQLHRHLVWPRSTSTGTHRTAEAIEDITMAVVQGEPLTKEQKKRIYRSFSFFRIGKFRFH